MHRAILLVLMFVAASTAGAQQVCNNSVVMPIKSLSIQEIGRLAERHDIMDSQFSISLWSFDTEDRPKQGLLRGVAFLMITTGDLSAKPVGAIVWMRDPRKIELNKTKDGKFTIVTAGSRSECANAIMEVRADGSVYANSVIIGRVE